MGRTRQRWLASHPYLAPLARFAAVVEEAAERVPPPYVLPPRWDWWARAHAEGVPLLRCGSAAGHFTSAAAYVLGRLAARAAETSPPGDVADALGEIRDGLRREAERRARAIAWVIEGAPPGDGWAHAGLLSLLAWTAVRHVLAPVLADPVAQREADCWARGSCPTCGSLPALGQLRLGDAVTARFLVCACCGTRWRWERAECPFCSRRPDERLPTLAIEGEPPLRIDPCYECAGYVKTYVGTGEEALYLSDWSTLHLDALARRHGLRRFGPCLYDLRGEDGAFWSLPGEARTSWA